MTNCGLEVSQMPAPRPRPIDPKTALRTRITELSLKLSTSTNLYVVSETIRSIREAQASLEALED
jgi:hypothetical protein